MAEKKKLLQSTWGRYSLPEEYLRKVERRQRRRSTKLNPAQNSVRCQLNHQHHRSSPKATSKWQNSLFISRFIFRYLFISRKKDRSWNKEVSWDDKGNGRKLRDRWTKKSKLWRVKTHFFLKRCVFRKPSSHVTNTHPLPPFWITPVRISECVWRGVEKTE